METSLIKQDLASYYLSLFPYEAASTLNKADAEEILRYLNQLDDEQGEEVLRHLSPDVQASVLEEMDETYFLALFNRIDSYSAAKFLSRLSTSSINSRILLLSDQKQKAIREMLTYPSDSAGFLMDTRIITFNPEDTVHDVLQKMRSIGDRKIVNIYVVDSLGILLGKIFIQTIAISPLKTQLESLLAPCASVQVMSPAEDVVTLFEKGININLPVLDLDGTLLGIIRNDALITATQEDASEDVMAMFGAGREERALSSPWYAIKKRLPWLQINLATAFLAASIVGVFEDTIAKVTVLAVFLPVVAGQSGNTGSQALAVTMRGLALREFQPSQWWKVARKEVVVGFVNGIAVAFTTSIIVFFWASSFGLALVIGSSMVLSMVIAGFSGAVVPIVLKVFGQDPAQSSSIVLTTVTDIMGFLSFLGLTTLLGSALGIL
ncbi:MAG: magnesium transporter [Cyclobacteriaceae bacterium]